MLFVCVLLNTPSSRIVCTACTRDFDSYVKLFLKRNTIMIYTLISLGSNPSSMKQHFIRLSSIKCLISLSGFFLSMATAPQRTEMCGIQYSGSMELLMV